MNNPQNNLILYVEQGSREAFEALVKEHLDLVYSAALRQVGDPTLAEDVSQAVFLVLSKKANTIRKKESLGGWLMTVTRHVSVNAMKKEIRQRRHERAAAKPESVEQEAAAWEKTSPLLDEALSKLPAADRDAVVMRFFQDKSFGEIGHVTGTTEEACRKRVTRAVEKLKKWLTARGTVLPAGILTAAIGTYAVQAAPAAIGLSCLAKASPTAEILAKGAMNMMSWKKIRSAALLSLAIAAIMAGVGIKLAQAGQPPTPTPKTEDPVKSAVAAPPPLEIVPGNDLLPFSMNMYKLMGEADAGKNLFYSPISIIEAFGMIEAGAKGDTAGELASAFGISQENMPQTIQKINAFLANRDNRPYTLTMANAIWADNGFPLAADFEKTVKEQYLSAGFNCDFKAKPEDERKRINEWVASNTADKIKDLMPERSIDANTKMVLTNAIYFKADWNRPFSETDTREEDFTLASGSKVKAKMMNQTMLGGGYFADDDFVAGSLPYKGNTMTLVAIMPAKGTFAEFEKKLTAERTEKILENISNSMLKISLPKFKMETSYQLPDLMKNLGIRKIFGGGDLSGITTSKSSINVTGAFHKAYLVVDERGTEAAAATGAAVGGSAGPGPAIPTFKADQPFLFLIQDRKTHAVLFMGRVMDPTATK